MADRSQPDRSSHHAELRPHPGQWPGGPVPHLLHEALLTLARKVHAAALDDDPQRLQQAALHLIDTLVVHVSDEAHAMSRLSPPQARILGRGQQRLLTAATELVDEAVGGCTYPPEWCRNRTEELLALLALQARDERVALHDPTA